MFVYDYNKRDYVQLTDVELDDLILAKKIKTMCSYGIDKIDTQLVIADAHFDTRGHTQMMCEAAWTIDYCG